MIWLIAVAGTVAGLVVGWLARGGRNKDGDTREDWKTRLAARDTDLVDPQQELADLIVEFESIAARSESAEVAESHQTSDGAAQELRDELLEARASAQRLSDEIEELRAATIPLAASEAMRSRVEEMEVELASLESMQCLDPEAHATQRLRPTRIGEATRREGEPLIGVDTAHENKNGERADDDEASLTDGSSGDIEGIIDETGDVSDFDGSASAGNGDGGLGEDLTAVKGVGPGVARLLRSMGITKYRQIVDMDDAALRSLGDLLNGGLQRLENHKWRESAREQHFLLHGEQI